MVVRIEELLTTLTVAPEETGRWALMHAFPGGFYASYVMRGPDHAQTDIGRVRPRSRLSNSTSLG